MPSAQWARMNRMHRPVLFRPRRQSDKRTKYFLFHFGFFLLLYFYYSQTKMRKKNNWKKEQRIISSEIISKSLRLGLICARVKCYLEYKIYNIVADRRTGDNVDNINGDCDYCDEVHEFLLEAADKALFIICIYNKNICKYVLAMLSFFSIDWNILKVYWSRKANVNTVILCLKVPWLRQTKPND